jgi:hypothetical protein
MNQEFNFTNHTERNIFLFQMTAQQVRAVIDIKAENFHQVFEESIGSEQSSSYEQLIAANERLKTNISKILTEFVNKARQEQEVNGDQKKRKIKRNAGFLFDEKKFCILLLCR